MGSGCARWVAGRVYPSSYQPSDGMRPYRRTGPGGRENRNPKPEIRRKAEIRSPNWQPPQQGSWLSVPAFFGFRTSDFLRISGFGFRFCGAPDRLRPIPGAFPGAPPRDDILYEPTFFYGICSQQSLQQAFSLGALWISSSLAAVEFGGVPLRHLQT
jgi:hypothetical protein